MPYFKIYAAVFATLTLAASVWASGSDELREKARAMQREAAALAERGQGEEAEHLERKALAVLEEAEHLKRHRPDQREAKIREMQARLEMLRMEERKLEEIGGKEEQIGNVRREAKRIERELHEVSHEGHHEYGDSPEGIARRLEHMRIAVENLHHAGLHDIAEHVAERAEATQRELQGHHRHHQDDPIHAMMKQLDEIRHEVGRLRGEVNELKERR